MAALARRVSQRPFVFTTMYVAMYLVLSALLSLPLTIYQDYVREHQYALSTQSFAAWGSDAIKALLIAMMIASPLIALLYTAVRKVGERWWLWATGGAALTMLFMLMLAPVLLAPLFTVYPPMPDGPIPQPAVGSASGRGRGG